MNSLLRLFVEKFRDADGQGARMFLIIYKANDDTPVLYLKVTKNVAIAQSPYIYCWKAY